MKNRNSKSHRWSYQCPHKRGVLALQVLFALVCNVAAQHTATAAGHCAADEVTYFSCPLEGLGKTASLCGTVTKPPIATMPGRKSPVVRELASLASLEYRYGAIDRIELRFGARAKEITHRFSVRSVYSLTARTDTVWFIKDLVTYGLEVREGEQQFAGIWVRYPIKYREFACQGSPGDLSTLRRLTR
jgi:hypothetical protein